MTREGSGVVVQPLLLQPPARRAGGRHCERQRSHLVTPSAEPRDRRVAESPLSEAERAPREDTIPEESSRVWYHNPRSIAVARIRSPSPDLGDPSFVGMTSCGVLRLDRALPIESTGLVCAGGPPRRDRPPARQSLRRDASGGLWRYRPASQGRRVEVHLPVSPTQLAVFDGE